MHATWVGFVGTQLCTRLAWTLIRCQAEGLFHTSPGPTAWVHRRHPTVAGWRPA